MISEVPKSIRRAFPHLGIVRPFFVAIKPESPRYNLPTNRAVFFANSSPRLPLTIAGRTSKEEGLSEARSETTSKESVPSTTCQGDVLHARSPPVWEEAPHVQSRYY